MFLPAPLTTWRTNLSASLNLGSPISTTHQIPNLPKSTSGAGSAKFLSTWGDNVGLWCKYEFLGQGDLSTYIGSATF